jgi:FAD:protein FMN transferase
VSGSSPRLLRAQPLLGTIVSVCVDGVSDLQARLASDAAFGAVSDIHRLMSFHEGSSDVGQLNCHAADRPVAVDDRTMQVLLRALEFAALSHGAFDITVARQLVERGWLPQPDSRHMPDPLASWQDIELLGSNRVRFHRPLWIDLGGIAKGYAVDHAFSRIGLGSEAQVRINAGGDLRVSGPETESILLRAASAAEDGLPVVRLHDGSLASSGGIAAMPPGATDGPHVHGSLRTTMGRGSFVSVIAGECLVADALTKVVMAEDLRAEGTLLRFGATAFVQDAGGCWQTMGARV